MWSGKKGDTSYSASLTVEISDKWLRKMEQASRFVDEQNAGHYPAGQIFLCFCARLAVESHPKCLRQLPIYEERGDYRRANVVQALVCLSETNVSASPHHPFFSCCVVSLNIRSMPCKFTREGNCKNSCKKVNAVLKA
jgi:hypothetical protein